MLVLAIAVGVNAVTLVLYGKNDADYSNAIDITEAQFDHVFNVKDNYARARMIIREIYYPNNTMANLDALYTELDTVLISARDELADLRQIVTDGARVMIDTIMPLVEKYRTDSKTVVDILRGVGYVDIDDQAYRNAMHNAQEVTESMAKEYADRLSSDITSLSRIQLEALQHVSTVLSDAAAQTQVVMAIFLVIIAVMAFYIPSLISKPLVPLTTFMKKASATGDIVFSPQEVTVVDRYSKYKDEIGQLIAATADFMKGINHEMDVLEGVADGDLTIQPHILSDKDKVGISLTKVVDNLNSMFSEIQAATAQVSTGSKQIADGAQSLAQGATEQAASIEELSSSIADIAEKTKINAATSGKTAVLSKSIKENAEKGSRQMDEMIAAVGDINESSKNISKIIKTVDDIAFQTNILALNAAVEAARAGQHGKGFAVVAEEVRSLAAKSAEAAKDTGAMIQNSMDKAELGVRIASETGESLKEIVTGINESSQLVSEIARSSEEQSLDIAQINTGLDQVAQVVQQNSATAEESAAASEEMSGQSDMLHQLIAQFKLD